MASTEWLVKSAGAPASSRSKRGLIQRAVTLAGSHGADLPMVLALIALGLAVHGANMFNAPGVLEDEGTYASQAWAVLHLHRLTPYTFTYDHAPGGWLLAAFWMLITGGPGTFGGTISSARVLMLLLHLAGIPLLYRLARKLGCRTSGAALATLIFTLSPLALAYQRAFVLDNVMVFWLLVSLNLLLDGWGRLSRLVLSGITFGLAVLSKETALFLLPALAYVAFRQRWKHHGRFSFLAWAVPALGTVSLYALYAGFKGELLPAGNALRFAFLTRGSHTSLVDAVRWQLTRQGGNPLSLHNAFWSLLRRVWFPKDPVMMGLGTAGVGFNLVRGIRDRRALAAGLLGLLPLLYLARGGVVFDFYVLFALPFLALNIGMAFTSLRDRRSAARAAGFAAAGGAAIVMALNGIGPYLLSGPARADRQAIAMVKRNLPPASRMIVADNFWADLHEAGLGGPSFPNAHSHWKVVADPAIRFGVFHNDWRNVDYLLTSTLNEGTFRATGNQVALDALHHSHVVRSWSSGKNDVRLWKVDRGAGPEQDPQSQSADYLARNFESQGAFVATDGSVTSEAQSYGLLRAVWSNDPKAFSEIWTWTAGHIQRPDGLFSWLWKQGRISDPSSATDADTDIAYALVAAGKRWGSQGLTEQGRRVAAAIWDKEVVSVKGRPYALAGDWGTKQGILPVNPSYFSPTAYRAFANADPGHGWTALLDAGYQLLDDASKANLGFASSAGLPPDWVGLQPAGGSLQRLDLKGKDTTRYGYDAARTFWRVALDYRWTGDARAAAFLRRAQVLDDEFGRKAAVSAVYSHDGQVVEDPPSPVGIAGALAALMTIDRQQADSLYWRAVAGSSQHSERGTFWNDPNDLYGQEWIWFAAAFYNNRLPDVWSQT